MDFTSIINEIKSGVAHLLFIDSEGKRIGSGSGFLSGGKLITCDHVIRMPMPNGAKVYIRFEDNSADNPDEFIELDAGDLSSKVVASSPEDKNDFAVLEIPGIDYDERYNFELGSVDDDVNVGVEILFLGYPFEHLNLVAHRGYISSIYPAGNKVIIQIDGSVNSSNSGGPLMHPYTKKVVGIITRKSTGLAKEFDQLIASLDTNIQLLSRPMSGSVQMMGIDPVKALLATQTQLKIVAQNMKRSSNVGIGYAFSLEKLVEAVEKVAV